MIGILGFTLVLWFINRLVVVVSVCLFVCFVIACHCKITAYVGDNKLILILSYLSRLNFSRRLLDQTGGNRLKFYSVNRQLVVAIYAYLQHCCKILPTYWINKLMSWYKENAKWRCLTILVFNFPQNCRKYFDSINVNGRSKAKCRSTWSRQITDTGQIYTLMLISHGR